MLPSLPCLPSPRHLRFLIVEELIGSTIVNFAINGGIAWLAFRKAASVPLWGLSSVAGDTLGTAFVLPVLTAFFADLLVRAQVVRGLLPPLAAGSLGPVAPSKRAWLQRGSLLGLLSMAVVALPTIAGVAFLVPPPFTVPGFIVFKASFAAALGAVVTPLLGWWALQDASRDA